MGCCKSQESNVFNKKPGNCKVLNSGSENYLDWKKSNWKVKEKDLKSLENVFLKTCKKGKIVDLRSCFFILKGLEGKWVENQKSLKVVEEVNARVIMENDFCGGVIVSQTFELHDNQDFEVKKLLDLNEPLIISSESWSLTFKPVLRPQFLTFRRKNFKKSVTICPVKPLLSIKEKNSATRNGKLDEILKDKSPSLQSASVIEKFKKMSQNRFQIFLLDLDPINREDLPQFAARHFELNEIIDLFEEMMHLKTKIDQQDVKEYKKPKEFSEFFIEFVNDKLGQHQIKDLIQVIYQLKSNQTIDIMKKLLGLSDSGYLTLPFSIYFCKLFSYFDKLLKNTEKMLKNYEKLQQITKSSKSPIRSLTPTRSSNLSQSPIRSVTPSKQSFQINFDKKATLIQIFEYIHKRFKDPVLTSFILPKLCPSSLSFNEFLMFYSVYKSKKIGCNIFKLPNKDYHSTILNFIDFSVTSEQESDLNSFLANSSRNYLKSMLSLTTHADNIQLCKFRIDKSTFLSVILEAYEKFRDLTVAAIAQLLQNRDTLNFEEFWEVVSECDSGVDQIQACQLFEMQDDSLRGVKSEWVIELLISSGVGYMKYFHPAGMSGLAPASLSPKYSDLDSKDLSDFKSFDQTSDEITLD